MKRLRNQTYHDIYEFVIEREKKPWRNWDKHGWHLHIGKPTIKDKKMSFEQLNNQLDLHLKMIGVIEPKYQRLVTEVPPYNYINSEMI